MVLRASMTFRAMLSRIGAGGLPVVVGISKEVELWRVRMVLAWGARALGSLCDLPVSSTDSGDSQFSLSIGIQRRTD